MTCFYDSTKDDTKTNNMDHQNHPKCERWKSIQMTNENIYKNVPYLSYNDESTNNNNNNYHKIKNVNKNVKPESNKKNNYNFKLECHIQHSQSQRNMHG